MENMTGLTLPEVEQRRSAGQTNLAPQSKTKTVKQIIRDNVCTYFNLVFIVLAVMPLWHFPSLLHSLELKARCLAWNRLRSRLRISF